MMKEIPKFLLDKTYMGVSAVFIVLFSFVFMLIYTPFSGTAWFGFATRQQAVITVAFYLVSMFVLGMSKFIMYRVQSMAIITKTRYILWLAGELVLIATTYIIFTQVFYPLDEPQYLSYSLRMIACVTLILAIPYTIATLYAVYITKKEELDMLRYRRQQELQTGENTSQLISLYDYNGILKMTIDLDAIYFVESQDNYVKIYYDNNGALHTYMLRCKTKTIEDSFAGTSMVRCHRSHIVNINKIRVMNSAHGKASLTLDHNGIKPIPVSKNYYETITALIANKK